MKPIAWHFLTRLPRALGIALLLWISLVSSRASAQQFRVPEPTGTEIFRRILHDRGCRPLSSGSDLLDEPSDSVLIVLGSAVAPDGSNPLAVSEHKVVTAVRFAEAGGAILFATDRSRRATPTIVFGQTISPGPVVVPGNSAAAYGNGELTRGLLVEPAVGDSPFKDLEHIAAIRPGYFASTASPFHVVARLPKQCEVARSRPLNREPFAVATENYKGAHGRVLLMVDQSVFSNALLWQINGEMANDNFKSAERCVDWLTESESGKRSRVLFIVDGEVIDNFYTDFLELPPPPLPRIEDVVHAVNQGIYGIESENHFNEWIDALAKRIPIRVVLVLVTIGLTALALIRLGQGKYAAEAGVPTLSAGLAQLVPSVSLVTQRKRWALREGNFGEVAQALAREFFEPLAVASTGAVPLVQVHANGWKAWRIRGRVRKLWRLAYGMQPRMVSSRGLAKLRARIAALRNAVADGTVVIVDSAETGTVNR
jgi:hypothetical protein